MESIKDLSFAGTSVSVAGRSIKDFMDDTNPVDFPDVELANIEWSVNGKMIRTAKPSPIIMSVTVIPGSSDDAFLYNKWKKQLVKWTQSNTGEWNNDLTASVQIGNSTMPLRHYSFSWGTFLSGPGGPSSSGDGKMQGRTYTFAFGKAT